MSELDPGFVFFMTVAAICAVGTIMANLASYLRWRKGRR